MHASRRAGLALGLGLAAAAAFAAVPRDREFYRTEPSPAAPRQIALAWLAQSAGELGVASADVAQMAVVREYPTRHNGVTHLALRQTVNGLEIDGTEYSLAVDSRGRLFHPAGALLTSVATRAAATLRTPLLGPDDAVIAAAEQLGFRPVNGLDVVEVEAGAIDQRVVFANREVSEERIPTRLRYLRLEDDRLRLTWHLSLKAPGDSNWWSVWIDAEDGRLLRRDNWTNDATYLVFPAFLESPDNGPRVGVVDPHLDGGTASPFGWHDTNGTVGAEFTITRGNNVIACADVDANNVCDAGSQPDGGAGLDFQPALDLATQQPSAYKHAAVVNLFYWNNVMHDVSYQYGFDEPAGNFQVNNYGNGGSGNDPVNADAQDGSELPVPTLNNANFSTPGDGSSPRMQMFRWQAPVELDLTGNLVATYPAGSASFGAATYNLAATDIVLANDGDAGVTNDGCCNASNTACADPDWAPLAGKIALVYRGGCEFGTKGLNMATAGAVAMILINNQSEGVVSMGPGVNGPLVPPTFPSVSVGLGNGNTLVAALPGVNGALNSATTVGPDRDSDLDNGVILHEYGHGISNRLTGTGPGCLSNAEQMGEGWSDWMSLFMNAEAGDTATTQRSIGGYVSFEPLNTPGYIGIRRYPYTTDIAVNPLTYAGVADLANSQPHGIGTIWATMVWEMYWNLVAIDGYDPDVYNGVGGNNLAHQLVIDGLKLQPCSPGFVDGRDAILAADLAAYDGDHECEIWEAFAKRGLGLSASQGSSFNRSDGVQAFDLPAQCGADRIFSSSFGHDGMAHWSDVEP